MTHNPVTLTEDRPFGHALHLMYENGVRHVPIVDANRRPLGVVTARDALQLDALTFGAECGARRSRSSCKRPCSRLAPLLQGAGSAAVDVGAPQGANAAVEILVAHRLREGLVRGLRRSYRGPESRRLM